MTAVESDSPGATERLAAELARGLVAGDVVLIEGDLGAGKTTFVRGALRAMGVTEPVVSPTFTIGRRYSGTHLISHLDLYRVGDIDAEDPGFLDDYLGPERVAFIEWPAAAAGRVSEVVARVRIDHAGGDRRLITILR